MGKTAKHLLEVWLGLVAPSRLRAYGARYTGLGLAMPRFVGAEVLATLRASSFD